MTMNGWMRAKHLPARLCILIESQQASARILKNGPDFLFFDYCNTSIRAVFGTMALETGLGDGAKIRLVDGAPGG